MTERAGPDALDARAAAADSGDGSPPERPPALDAAAEEASASDPGEAAAAPGGPVGTAAEVPGRPLLERIGMAAIALVLALLFGAVAAAAFGGGEPFLGAMAAIGCLMTVWVGAITLLRG